MLCTGRLIRSGRGNLLADRRVRQGRKLASDLQQQLGSGGVDLLADELASLSDDELKAKTEEVRARLADHLSEIARSGVATEIDEAVIRIAENANYFTYLTEARSRPGTTIRTHATDLRSAMPEALKVHGGQSNVRRDASRTTAPSR